MRFWKNIKGVVAIYNVEIFLRFHCKDFLILDYRFAWRGRVLFSYERARFQNPAEIKLHRRI
ncbi:MULTISPECIES: hypothetical protein [Helicobacter]|uniref:hypothetical protein n=1 Tax=Helicobacter TaxID=209 RepID=UPI0011C02FF7|nr:MULTISPECIES: hypothetical protein [Helicobacter]